MPTRTLCKISSRKRDGTDQGHNKSTTEKVTKLLWVQQMHAKWCRVMFVKIPTGTRLIVEGRILSLKSRLQSTIMEKVLYMTVSVRARLVQRYAVQGKKSRKVKDHAMEEN